MKETKLKSEKYIIYVKKATAFIPGLRFNVGTVKILILIDLFSNFARLSHPPLWNFTLVHLYHDLCNSYTQSEARNECSGLFYIYNKFFRF